MARVKNVNDEKHLLRAMRRSLGSQPQVAERLGISTETLRRYEQDASVAEVPLMYKYALRWIRSGGDCTTESEQ